MIPRLSFLGLHYIVLHIKMHIFTYESARIHTSYTDSLASCSYEWWMGLFTRFAHHVIYSIITAGEVGEGLVAYLDQRLFRMPQNNG